MKIFAYFYFYNNKKENIPYNIDTKLSIIIKDVNEFLLASDKNINFENLVIKWSDLYELFKKNGDIPLFKLLKTSKKFKICYGGYVKFLVKYNSKVQSTIFKANNYAGVNKFFLIFDFIMKYLTVEEKLKLSLINKYAYKKILEQKLFKADIYFENSCFDEEE